MLEAISEGGGCSDVVFKKGVVVARGEGQGQPQGKHLGQQEQETRKGATPDERDEGVRGTLQSDGWQLSGPPNFKRFRKVTLALSWIQEAACGTVRLGDPAGRPVDSRRIPEALVRGREEGGRGNESGSSRGEGRGQGVERRGKTG